MGQKEFVMKQFIFNKIANALHSVEMSTRLWTCSSKFSVEKTGRCSDLISHQSTEFSPPIFPLEGSEMVFFNGNHFLLMSEQEISTERKEKILPYFQEYSPWIDGSTPQWSKFISTLVGGLFPASLVKTLVEEREVFPHGSHPDFYFVYCMSPVLQGWNEDNSPSFKIFTLHPTLDIGCVTVVFPLGEKNPHILGYDGFPLREVEWEDRGITFPGVDCLGPFKPETKEEIDCTAALIAALHHKGILTLSGDCKPVREWLAPEGLNRPKFKATLKAIEEWLEG